MLKKSEIDESFLSGGNYETYHCLFRDYHEGRLIRPGGSSASFCFCNGFGTDKRYRLLVVGETELFYQWKNEPDYPMQYRTITDALNSHNANRAQYCLDLSCSTPLKYVKRVYKKILWPPVLSYLAMCPIPENWKSGIWAKAEDLSYSDGGYLRIRIEIRETHEGVNRHSVANSPDRVILVDFPEGTWNWREFSREMKLPPAETACVGFWLEGCGYTGNVYFEKPFLMDVQSVNLLPDFAPPVSDRAYFDWTGQNLSRKEWPEFEVVLNKERIFRNEIFERCHRNSEWEISIPKDVFQSVNCLEIKLVSDYHDPLPYCIHEIGIIEVPAAKVTLVACSQVGTVSDGAHILLRTTEKNAQVKIKWDDESAAKLQYCFAEPGLHGIHLDCLKTGQHKKYTIFTDGEEIRGEIPVIIQRIPDGVITGTGDMIYIEQSISHMEEYLSWYISNHIGNLLTIRPTYRWSGSRVLNGEAFKWFVRVLNELQIRYVLMLDGRELPGINANPDSDLLAGRGYLGTQCHEMDGAAFYWTTRMSSDSLMAEQYSDMEQRAYLEDPFHCQPWHSPANFWYDGDAIYQGRNPHLPRDYRQSKEIAISSLRKLRNGARRHTGPSTMFAYLFEAGYQWLGAETMYGTMEILMSFLRGACRAVGIDDYGVHHAVQWSSSPQDAPEHIRRYRLALYVSYMHGATQINTEEGLWHLEEYYSYYHRFSECCRTHLVQQQDFFRYVSTHSRTGRFYAPMAIIRGRYDGWHGFGNHWQWGWADVENGEAEKSWDLLKAFYPQGKPGEALYLHGCAENRAVGFFSYVPMGNVDILPAETERKVLEGYGATAFLGYHCAEVQDEKFLAYVKRGGKLLLTRAHLTISTDLKDIATGRLKETSDNPLHLAIGEARYTENHVSGIPVMVCTNIQPPDRVLCYTDEGMPLICDYQVGKGSITIVHALAYPAHPAIRHDCEKQLVRLMKEQTDTQRIWYECGDDVEVAVYDHEDGTRHLYFLAIDWYRAPDRRRNAVLKVGANRYQIQFCFGNMIKCVVCDDIAVWCHSEEGEILSIANNQIQLQGTGNLGFSIGYKGRTSTIEVDFTKEPIVTVEGYL